MRQGFIVLLIFLFIFCQKKISPCGGVHSNSCAQIATFNLEYFPSGKEKKLSPQKVHSRMKKMAQFWQKEGLDIVAAQEVLEDKNALEKFTNQYLNQDYSYVIGKSGPVEQKLAIFYRRNLFLLEEFQELNKRNTQGIIDENKFHWQSPLRLPLEAKFKSKESGFSFLLITVHLKAGSDPNSCDIRKRQANDLALYLMKKNEPLILAGDFNDILPETGICKGLDTLESFEKLEKNQKFFFATWPGEGIEKNAISFFSFRYRSLIDHIYISHHLKDRLILLNSYWATIAYHNNRELSDHQAVVIWLRLKDSAP